MARVPATDAAAAIGPFLFERSRLQAMVEEAERVAAAAEPERDRSKSARKALANSGKRSTSNHKGVNLHARSNRWEAHIWDGHQVHVGCYDTELQAAVAYDLVALRLRGDDAKLNFPTADYSSELDLLQQLTKEQVLMAMRGQPLEQRPDGSYWVAGVGPAATPLKTAGSTDSEDGVRPVRSSRRPPPSVYLSTAAKSTPTKSRGRAKAVKRPRPSQTTGPRSPRPATKRFCLPTLTLRARTPPTPSFSSSDSDTQGSISPEPPVSRGAEVAIIPGSIYSASNAAHQVPQAPAAAAAAAAAGQAPKSSPSKSARTPQAHLPDVKLENLPDDHLMALCDRLSEPERIVDPSAPFSPVYSYSQHTYPYAHGPHLKAHAPHLPYRSLSPALQRPSPSPAPHVCPCCAALHHSNAMYPTYLPPHPMDPSARSYGHQDTFGTHTDRFTFPHPYPPSQPTAQSHHHSISHPSTHHDSSSPTPPDYPLPYPHPAHAYHHAHPPAQHLTNPHPASLGGHLYHSHPHYQHPAYAAPPPVHPKHAPTRASPLPTLAYASPFTSSMNSLSSAESSCPISPKSSPTPNPAAPPVPSYSAPATPADLSPEADLDLDSFFMESSSDLTAPTHLPASFPHPGEGLPLDCGPSDALLLEQFIAEGLDV